MAEGQLREDDEGVGGGEKGRGRLTCKWVYSSGSCSKFPKMGIVFGPGWCGAQMRRA